MFDFGFSEMLLIGAVALVVLGPERLPVVARTAGEWMGKAQRFVSQVKYDIERESHLQELKQLQNEARTVADDVRMSVQAEANAIEKDVSSVAKSVTDSETDAEGMESTKVKDSPKSFTPPSSKEVADFYGWNSTPRTFSARNDEESKIFAKRFHYGPTVDELAEEVSRLRRELGMREAQLGGGSRRLGTRARTNRPRIYR